MKQETKDSSTKNITLLFIALIIIYPFLYYIMLHISLGQASTGILKPLLIFYPVIAFFAVIFFISKNRYLDKIIDYILSGREVVKDELADPVKNYPVESMVILFFSCLSAPLIAILAGFKGGIVVSPQHGFFMFINGAVPALICGAVLYHRIRMIILKYSLIVGLRPPAYVERLSVPVIAVFLCMATPVYAWLCRIYDRQLFVIMPEFRGSIDTLIMVIPLFIVAASSLIFAVIYFVADRRSGTVCGAGGDRQGNESISSAGGMTVESMENLEPFLYKLRNVAGWTVSEPDDKVQESATGQGVSVEPHLLPGDKEP